MEPLSKEERERLTELERWATPPPWKRHHYLGGVNAIFRVDDDNKHVDHVADTYYVKSIYAGGTKDAEFIASARNALPRLLADLQQVEGERDEARLLADMNESMLTVLRHAVVKFAMKEALKSLGSAKDWRQWLPSDVAEAVPPPKGLQTLRRLEETERERDALRQRVQESEGREVALRGALMLYVDINGPDGMHEDDCPQDDTCNCLLAATVNAALSTEPPPLWDLLQRLVRQAEFVAQLQVEVGSENGESPWHGWLCIPPAPWKALQVLVAEVKGAMGQ